MPGDYSTASSLAQYSGRHATAISRSAWNLTTLQPPLTQHAHPARLSDVEQPRARRGALALAQREAAPFQLEEWSSKLQGVRTAQTQGECWGVEGGSSEPDYLLVVCRSSVRFLA